MKYAFVHDEAKIYSVQLLCEVMEISRSGYYAKKSRCESKQAQEHQQLMIFPRINRH